MLNATTQKIFSVGFLIMDLSDQVDAAVLRLDYEASERDLITLQHKQEVREAAGRAAQLTLAQLR